VVEVFSRFAAESVVDQSPILFALAVSQNGATRCSEMDDFSHR
jgi:hypothetical protein